MPAFKLTHLSIIVGASLFASSVFAADPAAAPTAPPAKVAPAKDAPKAGAKPVDADTKKAPAVKDAATKDAASKKKAKEEPAAAPPPALYSTKCGFGLRDLSPKESKKLGRTGFFIDSVSAESPAGKAGLKVGDIVTSVDAATIPTLKDLLDRLQGSAEGQLLKVSVVRDGKDMLVDVQLAGETEAEREKREEEEREIQDAKDKAEEEAKEKAEEEAKEKAEEEAKKKLEEEATETIEAEDDDKFGPLGCCICSALCFPLTPVWVIAMLLVEADIPNDTRLDPRAPQKPSDEEGVVTVVRY